MSDFDRKKGKLIQLFKDGGSKADVSSQITISGNANIVGNGNTVIHTTEHISRPTIVIAKGDGYISDQQAALLSSLVKEIVKIETVTKRKPRSYGAVWSSLFLHLSTNKKHPEIPRYRLIPAELFEKAERYLRQTIGRLSASKTAPKNDPTWRNRKYAFIKTNVQKHGLTDKLKDYLITRHCVTTLVDLDDQALSLTYAAVARWVK